VTVETIFHLRAGGELKWSLGGLLLGALMSVAPLDIALFLFPLPFVAAHFMQLSPRGGRSAHVCFLVAVAATVTLAILAPVKAIDRRVDLYASRLALPELATALELKGSAPNVIITLPSGTPTLREIDEAIAQQAGMRIRWETICASGFTLLFGSYPDTGYLEPAD